MLHFVKDHLVESSNAVVTCLGVPRKCFNTLKLTRRSLSLFRAVHQVTYLMSVFLRFYFSKDNLPVRPYEEGTRLQLRGYIGTSTCNPIEGCVMLGEIDQGLHLFVSNL